MCPLKIVKALTRVTSRESGENVRSYEHQRISAQFRTTGTAGNAHNMNVEG